MRGRLNAKKTMQTHEECTHVVHVRKTMHAHEEDEARAMHTRLKREENDARAMHACLKRENDARA